MKCYRFFYFSVICKMACAGDQLETLKLDSGSQKQPKRDIELGFVERTDKWRLRSKFFPSKVGGQAAWLDLKDLPPLNKLQCKICADPFTFLMQVYSPFEGNENAFHRTIMVFMCRNSACCEENSNKNFAVFRSQLPRVNQYYDSEPPQEVEEGSSKPSVGDYHLTCAVCGNPSKQRCSRCRSVVYCCRQHQKLDWRTRHKAVCVDYKESDDTTGKKETEIPYFGHNFLLPEYEVVTELEELTDEKLPERTEEEKMEEYRKFLKRSKARIYMRGDNSEEEELEEIALKNDKIFSKFLKIVNQNPDQVLRYDRGGIPLWVSFTNIPNERDIPSCACGSKRQFEFQVMPQLLNYLGLDEAGHSIDWGTLAVYTCSRSCDFGFAYKEEFLWKQDFESIIEPKDDSMEDEELERSRSTDDDD